MHSATVLTNTRSDIVSVSSPSLAMVILKKSSCHLRPILWRLPCCEEAQVNCIETLLGEGEMPEAPAQPTTPGQCQTCEWKAIGWDNLSSTETYTLPYVKQIARGSLIYDALSRCSVTTQRGRKGKEVGGGFKREGTYVHLMLIQGDVWQKPSQYRKVIIL